MAVSFTVQQIKDANTAAGYNWFEPATIRFFRSRFSGPVTANMFVSSEQREDTEPRRYTIRRANDDGSIGTIGDFQQYGTKAAALSAIRRIANEEQAAIMARAIGYEEARMNAARDDPRFEYMPNLDIES